MLCECFTESVMSLSFSVHFPHAFIGTERNPPSYAVTQMTTWPLVSVFVFY